MTFTQVTARLKNFLMGWLLALSLKEGLLLVLGLKEGLAKCATVCVKSEVILGSMYVICKMDPLQAMQFLLCARGGIIFRTLFEFARIR